MNNTILISKIDAARRQLETALYLYFTEDEPVSIHTLICAAHEILETLHIQNNGIPTFLHKNSPGIKNDPRKRKKYHDIISDAKNFFKHANKDPERILEFDTQKTEAYLLDSIYLFQHLTQVSHIRL